MSWSFSRKTRLQKPAAQLMQEASLVLAMGGGYQAYFKQDRDGAVRDLAELDVMAQVARFCRERQAFCHHSLAVPQIALLYSTVGHYAESPRLFHWSGSPGVAVLRKALTGILENQYGVQILSEHHLHGQMSQWPVIVVPGWKHLAPDFCAELVAYAEQGGRLLLIDPVPDQLFQSSRSPHGSSDGILTIDAVDENFPTILQQALPEPIVTVTGSKDIDVSPRRLDDRLTIHLVNTSGPHAKPPIGGIPQIEPIGPLNIEIRLARKPKAVTLQPGAHDLSFTWNDGLATLTLPRLDVYSILVVSP
jgi:hypothetical protein